MFLYLFYLLFYFMAYYFYFEITHFQRNDMFAVQAQYIMKRLIVFWAVPVNLFKLYE